jgi:hypothetical protein
LVCHTCQSLYYNRPLLLEVCKMPMIGLSFTLHGI